MSGYAFNLVPTKEKNKANRKKMMDTPEEVTVKDALKAPKVVFISKQKMCDAANKVELSINRGKKETTSGGTTTELGSSRDDSFG